MGNLRDKSRKYTFFTTSHLIFQFFFHSFIVLVRAFPRRVGVEGVRYSQVSLDRYSCNCVVILSLHVQTASLARCFVESSDLTISCPKIPPSGCFWLNSPIFSQLFLPEVCHSRWFSWLRFYFVLNCVYFYQKSPSSEPFHEISVCWKGNTQLSHQTLEM